MLSIWAERANVAGAVVHQTVPDHLVLSFESSPTFAALTTFNRTVVRSIGTMYVEMGATRRVSGSSMIWVDF